jgi:uncharacterized protein (TIGR02145 family)
MKTKHLFTVLLLTFNFLLAAGQTPQGFNYQAIVRNANGVPVASQAVPVRISVVTALTGGTVIWQEEFSSVTTDAYGLISLVVGNGTRTGGSATTFSAIDWSAQTLFLKTEVKYPGTATTWTEMGTSQIWSVPYSLMAKNIAPLSKLGINGTTDNMDEALFEVKNKAGNTVFAVYNEGVRVSVGNGNAKGTHGGFSVGGYDGTKGVHNLLTVTSDSVRVYVDSNPATKGTKGGFAVGGYDMTKGGTAQNYFNITPDSTRVYINDSETKGAKGGFSVGGFDMSKGVKDEYLRITRDSTRVYINNTGTKGSKGGFAVGGFDMSKGTANKYMSINPDSTMFYVVQSLDKGSSSTFNIVGINGDDSRKYLMQANTDTVGINGVLNVQNNLVVAGDINISGSTIQDSSLVSDMDGNKYKTIKIGTQIWMAEDLKTTKYNDGTPIPNITDNTAWMSSYNPGYCWYNNDKDFKSTYGALYNFSAISAGMLCPQGWHVPTDYEWSELSIFLGGEGVGGKIKEAGTAHWVTPNQDATNSTGFTALPGGGRDINGLFNGMGLSNTWWTSSMYTEGSSYSWSVNNTSGDLTENPGTYQVFGAAVRCIYGPSFVY